jgi:hypothetical protein
VRTTRRDDIAIFFFPESVAWRQGQSIIGWHLTERGSGKYDGNEAGPDCR